MTAVTGAINLNQYGPTAEKLGQQAVGALSKMFQDEVNFTQSKKEPFPAGTTLASFSTTGPNQINGTIRTKILYDKVVIKDIEEKISRLPPEKTIAFVAVLNSTSRLIQKQNELFQRCLSACDPTVTNSIASSPLVRSLIYYMVTAK